MQTNFFFLSPVQVVKVTSQNLDEVAEWCGGTVQETESRRVKDRMDKYVWVPTPKGNAISWAFPGMFVTKRLVVTIKGDLRATFAVFRRDYFEKNYFETNAAAGAATWERELLEANKKPKSPEIVVNVSVAEAMNEALEKVKVLEKRLNDLGADEVVTPNDEPLDNIMPDGMKEEIYETVKGRNYDGIKVVDPTPEVGKRMGKTVKQKGTDNVVEIDPQEEASLEDHDTVDDEKVITG